MKPKVLLRVSQSKVKLSMGLKHLRIRAGRGASELSQVVGRMQLFCSCETYVPISRLALSQLALSAAKATPVKHSARRPPQLHRLLLGRLSPPAPAS